MRLVPELLLSVTIFTLLFHVAGAINGDHPRTGAITYAWTGTMAKQHDSNRLEGGQLGDGNQDFTGSSSYKSLFDEFMEERHKAFNKDHTHHEHSKHSTHHKHHKHDAHPDLRMPIDPYPDLRRPIDPYPDVRMPIDPYSAAGDHHWHLPQSHGQHKGDAHHHPAGVPHDGDHRKSDHHPKPPVHEAPQLPQDKGVESRSYSLPFKSGQVTELHNLKYSTGRHSGPDAMVYIPDGFDPNKPIRVMVYNHGLGSDAKDAFRDSKLQEQMAQGDANTILIVPEWQTKTHSRESSSKDRFHQDGFFDNMLDEIMSKTPALQGKTSRDIASMGLITHSGGYMATMSEMYSNHFYNKVTSLTVLDSMYNPKGFDRWISDNIEDLARGKKHLLVVYTDHLSHHSNGLADRMSQMLKEHGISPAVMVRDGNHPKDVTSDGVLRNHGIVFKYSTLNNGEGAHGTMTTRYVREVVNAEAGSNAQQYASNESVPPWRFGSPLYQVPNPYM